MQTYSQTVSRMYAGMTLPYAKLVEQNAFTPVRAVRQNRT
jgi:hypothetical protein